MIFKEIVERSCVVRNGRIVNVNENNSFQIKMMRQGDDLVCYVHTMKGNFTIEDVEGSTKPYDAENKCFFLPWNPLARIKVTFRIEMDQIFQECMLENIKISREQLMKLKLKDFYKGFITLPGYEYLKFMYYVKKIDYQLIEVHILNPYDDVLIEDKPGDYKHQWKNTFTGNEDGYIDLELNLRFTFASNISETITDESKSTTVAQKEDQINIKNPRLYDVMSDKAYADVVLFSSTGKEILTYRCLLASFSPVFKKIFDETKDLPIQHKIDEFETEIIMAALDFCYGKVDAISGKETKIFKFAEKYKIQELKEACCSHFEKDLNISNVCDIIQIAYSNNFEDLKQKCKTLIARNKETIDFENLPKNIIIDILKAT